MTLSFGTQINGKPNYFIEKIWRAIVMHKLIPASSSAYHSCKWEYKDKFGNFWDGAFSMYNPKLHTIRNDEKNRWKAGVNIHPVIKPKGRFSAGFQFAPVIECKSTQTIRISYEDGKPNVYIDGFPFYFHTRRNTFGEDKMNQLAINDGFDSMADFFAYFNTDFTGNLIHFTDLKY